MVGGSNPPLVPKEVKKMTHDGDFEFGEKEGQEEVDAVIASLPKGKFLAFAAKYEFPGSPSSVMYSVQIGCEMLGITRRGTSRTSLQNAANEALGFFDTVPFGEDPFDAESSRLWMEIHGGKQ